MAAFIAAWREVTGRFPGHRIAAGGGVTATLAGIPTGFFNLVFLDRPVADGAGLARALDVAKGHVAAFAHPAMLVINPAWAPPGWEAALAAAGFTPATVVTGMAADAMLPPARPLPAMAWRRVAGLDGAADIAEINARAYGMPDEEAGPMTTDRLWLGGSFGVIGDADGTRQACAATFLIGDMIYVAMVATEPEAQRRGCAEAVMREAIAAAEAAGGPRRIWLHATEAGRPVYARMGFEAGSTLRLYSFPAAV